MDRVDNLAKLFTSPTFPDSLMTRIFLDPGKATDTAAERLTKVLKETQHWLVPGLQTG